jgi:tryptophan synthase alpha chain
MNPIDALFHSRRAAVRKVFVPFVPAGDPDLDTTARLLPALASAGAGLIEIGFPFSDPIADGPVIQAAYTRALNRGVKLDQIFGTIGRTSRDPALAKVPLVGMVSYSLIFRRRPDRFLDQAKSAGFSGLIIPDLPPEEAGPLCGLAASRDMKSILLVTPTTPRDRAARIAKLSTGFLYCVSVTGITGERDKLPPELLDQLRWLRTQTTLPLCVGFGVSRPEHIAMLRDAVDGVIVGSAIVRLLDQIGERPAETVNTNIEKLVRELVRALES